MPANRISNQDVIPEIQSDIFVGHEDSRFAVGIVAVGKSIVTGLDSEYQGYGLLRGNVYAYQKDYMSASELNADGTETDSDDARSVHFAIIENAVRSPRVVGAMRLIIKSNEDDSPLPIEHHYPEAFTGGPSPVLSTEVSRWIGRHEDPKIQNGLKWPLFTAGTAYIAEHQLGPVYGAVEPVLARGLNMSGVPVTPLSEPHFVPEFNAFKLPIRVDMSGITRTIEGERPDLLANMNVLAHDFVYSGVAQRTANEGSSVA